MRAAVAQRWWMQNTRNLDASMQTHFKMTPTGFFCYCSPNLFRAEGVPLRACEAGQADSRSEYRSMGIGLMVYGA